MIARDPARPSERRTVIRNRIWVHGDDVFCVTGTQNRALTINGNNATVEFYSTGVVTGFTCVVDRSEIMENCKSILNMYEQVYVLAWPHIALGHVKGKVM